MNKNLLERRELAGEMFFPAKFGASLPVVLYHQVILIYYILLISIGAGEVYPRTR
jgi:hypothetical protein